MNIRKFRHTRLFKVICGVVIVLLILALYNCIVRSGSGSSSSAVKEEVEAEERALLKDTFDVVGDYLFPSMKGDESIETEKEEKKDNAEEKREKRKENVEAEEEIMESADIASDPTPAPPAPTAPPVEKMETPKVEAIE